MNYKQVWKWDRGPFCGFFGIKTGVLIEAGLVVGIEEVSGEFGVLMP
jgi:hypothetical protein